MTYLPSRRWDSMGSTGLVMITLILLSVHCPATANPFPGNSPWQGMPPGQWNFAPPERRQSSTPTKSQPTATTQSPYAGWPGRQYPGYSPQNYYSTPTPAPQIETKLSIQSPYVQQNVILKISVVSQNNLRTATPHISSSDHFILQQLEDPVTYSRTRNGKRQIVNDFYFTLTPLKAGLYQLPNLSIAGEEEQLTTYSRGNRSFDVSMNSPPHLEIRETDPDSTPWLPVEQLDLKIQLPSKLKAAAGKPFTLVTEINAVGIAGEQLPSLEQQLKSDAFRIYREQSRVETNLNKSTDKLVSRRLETFTLVPQYGGDLKLPQLSVNWWNTRIHVPQRASIPLQPIAVSGTRKASGFFNVDEESTLFPAGASSAFWIPLSVVFGVIFGYWLAIWISHRRKGDTQHSPLAPLVAFLQRPMQQMAPAFSPLKAKLRTTTTILNPAAHWQRWRRNLVGMLPLSVRFYFCVRFVDEETDPEVWGYTLRFLANKHLSLPPNVPFSVIGKHIIDFHPKAQEEKIRALIHELEQAIYGHSNLDFDRWKEAFKHEIRPSIRLWPRRSRLKSTPSGSLLPNLNPDKATSG
ncbi:MAG: hypothetical protein JAY66_09330 [Candidatus Thiodiazotropha taylori]|nr:hypothetical protein [Candidatus Thiodiazotropha taylori]